MLVLYKLDYTTTATTINTTTTTTTTTQPTTTILGRDRHVTVRRTTD